MVICTGSHEPHVWMEVSLLQLKLSFFRGPRDFSHLCLGWRLTLPGLGWWLPQVYSGLCIPGLMAVVHSNNKDKGCYQSHIKSPNQLTFLKCLIHKKNEEPHVYAPPHLSPAHPSLGSSACRRDNRILRRELASAERHPSVKVQ